MIAIDTSLLAYAINRYAPEHGRAAAALEALASGDTPWGVPWPVVHEFLGLVTHPHRVARVLRARDAWGLPVGFTVVGSERVRQAATNSFHFWTRYAFSSMIAFQQAMPPMRAS